MTPDPADTEIIDRNGDRWYVRECEADEDCFVLERYAKRARPSDELDRLVQKYAAQIEHPDEPDQTEPRDELARRLAEGGKTP